MRPARQNTNCKRLIVLTMVCAALSGCQSLDQIAPPVAVIAGERPADSLALGRELYVGKCTKCHAPEPVRKYPAAKWEDIIADMANETKLSPHETAAVRDYVMAVLARPDSPRR